MERTNSTTNDMRTNLFMNRSFNQLENQYNGSIPKQNYVDTKLEDEADIRETRNLLQNHEYRKEIITDKLQHKECQREATTRRKAFIMVACLYLHITSGGTVIALGVIYVDLIRVFNAPHSQAALVQSLFMGLMIGGGVIFTGLLQRHGTGLPVTIASFIAGMAFFASSFAPNVPTLIVLIGVVGGLSMCVNYLSAFVSIGWTFQKNKKSVLALLTIGWTIGQTSFPYIAQYLMESLRWNGSLIILSAIILNCIPCGLVLHKSRQFFFINNLPANSLRDTLCGCLKDYLFVIFVLAYFLCLSLAPIEMWFIADLTILKGFDRSTGSILLSLLGISGLVGRIVGVFLLYIFKNTEALVHAFYSIIIWGIGHFLIGYVSVLWGLFCAVVLRGLAAGITIAAMPGSQIELRGAERFPQTLAVCNLMGGTAQILGGLFGGATVDITGGYDFIFTFAALDHFVCGLLIIFVWLLLKRHRKAASAVHKTDNEQTNEREPLIPKGD